MSAREQAVEVMALHLWRKQFGEHHERAYEPYFQNVRDILAALNAAGLAVLNAQDVFMCVFTTEHSADEIREASARILAALADQSGGDHE